MNYITNSILLCRVSSVRARALIQEERDPEIVIGTSGQIAIKLGTLRKPMAMAG